MSFDSNTSETSVWKAIWLLVRLQFFRTRNQFSRGKDKTGVLGYLGMFFVLLMCVFMVYQVVAHMFKVPFHEQESFSLVLHLVLVLFFFAFQFSFKSKNAGATEQDTLWLMTLPIRMSTISLMKITRIAFFNFTGTLLLLPMVSITTFMSFGWSAVVPTILLIYFPFVFTVATMVHLTDMLLGFLLKPAARKYLSFLFSIVLFFSYFALYQIHFSTDNRLVFETIVKIGEDLSFLGALPLFKSALIPFLFIKEQSLGVSVLLEYLVFCFSVIFLCGVFINGLTNRGLREKHGSNSRTNLGKSSKLNSIIGKEILLLYREKRLWFSLLLPILMITVNQI